MTLAKKPTAVFLAVAMFFSFALANFTVSAAGQSDTIVSGTAVTVPDADGGMTFAKNEYYRIDKPLIQISPMVPVLVKLSVTTVFTAKPLLSEFTQTEIPDFI